MYIFKTLQVSTLLFILVLCANIMEANAQTSDTDALKATINEHYSTLTQHIKDNKPSELAKNLYTTDAKFYPPNGGMVEGTEGITKAFQGLIGAGLIIDPEAQEVEIYGDHAYEYGIATLYNKEGEQLGKERYICIWKNVNGEWKIYRDFVKGIKM